MRLLKIKVKYKVENNTVICEAISIIVLIFVLNTVTVVIIIFYIKEAVIVVILVSCVSLTVTIGINVS